MTRKAVKLYTISSKMIETGMDYLEFARPDGRTRISYVGQYADYKSITETERMYHEETCEIRRICEMDGNDRLERFIAWEPEVNEFVSMVQAELKGENEQLEFELGIARRGLHNIKQENLAREKRIDQFNNSSWWERVFKAFKGGI